LPQTFDAFQFLHHLLRRWRFVASVCLGALALALIVSLILPKRYTATASLVIDPPAGNDPRTSIAVSTTYLESLRAYELFASSDSLLVSALEKFHLRDPQSPEALETIKRRVLKVAKVRDTRILQISVTLADPNQARDVAQFLAQETVSLNRSANREGDQEMIGEAQRQADEAVAAMERAQTAWSELNIREPLEPIRAELATLTELHRRVREDLLESRAEAGEFAARGGERLAGAKARAETLEKQDTDLAHQIEIKAAQLSRRSARDDELRQKLSVAQEDYRALTARLREVRNTSGLRGERLRIIDPGVAPERPSSPILILNLALALGVALIGAITWLALTFRPEPS
jgi:succinoglycan biosynthesis transport protein ExoP